MRWCAYHIAVFSVASCRWLHRQVISTVTTACKYLLALAAPQIPDIVKQEGMVGPSSYPLVAYPVKAEGLTSCSFTWHQPT